MRWNQPREPRKGDVYRYRCFLLFPKTIDKVTRWMEWATWEVELVTVNRGTDEYPIESRKLFQKERWVDIDTDANAAERGAT